MAETDAYLAAAFEMNLLHHECVFAVYHPQSSQRL